jgi:GAF domain-containing protein
MIERGHALSVGKQGIVGYVAEQKKPRIAVDVGLDAVFFNNPDLPMTRSEIAIPLLSRDKVLGVLDIQSDKPQAFNIEDIDVLQTLADQIAVAIENARLLDESQAALAQLEALTAIRTRDAWSQKLQGRSRVFTYTPLGLRAEKLSPPGGHTIAIPVTLRGQKIGTISLARRGNANITKSDEELISEVASQTGLAIDNIRLLEEATQRARQEQVVGKLAGRFSQSLDIDTLLQTAVRELAQLPDVAEVSVFIGEQSNNIPARQKTRRSSG